MRLERINHNLHGFHVVGDDGDRQAAIVLFADHVWNVVVWAKPGERGEHAMLSDAHARHRLAGASEQQAKAWVLSNPTMFGQGRPTSGVHVHVFAEQEIREAA